MRTEYSTRPREQITALLRKERRYLSAADIHTLLKKTRSKVALSTIYRTLGLLETKGAVSQRVDDHGESTYVSCAPTHHHHAICRKCGKVEEVACEAMESFAGELRTHHGFELDDHAMEFFGRCATCK